MIATGRYCEGLPLTGEMPTTAEEELGVALPNPGDAWLWAYCQGDVRAPPFGFQRGQGRCPKLGISQR